jgi:histidine triad (HIT) family protein
MPEGTALMAPWVSELIAGPEQRLWEKPDPDHTFRGRLDGTRTKPDEIVYQDDDVLAFRHNIDRSKEEWWEIHVVIIPKKWIPTLLDVGLGDAKIWHSLIAGIQKVALTLGLYEHGFTIRMGVLPPYQHTEHLHIHILAGKHASPVVNGPLPDAG